MAVSDRHKNDEEARAMLGLLQERPTTSLTDLPASIYAVAKHRVTHWEPAPCPPRGEWP
jgi:hypothetical protein